MTDEEVEQKLAALDLAVAAINITVALQNCESPDDIKNLRKHGLTVHKFAMATFDQVATKADPAMKANIATFRAALDAQLTRLLVTPLQNAHLAATWLSAKPGSKH